MADPLADFTRTEASYDGGGHPTRAALDQVMAFFAELLRS